jgi:hypothetical protein
MTACKLQVAAIKYSSIWAYYCICFLTTHVRVVKTNACYLAYRPPRDAGYADISCPNNDQRNYVADCLSYKNVHAQYLVVDCQRSRTKVDVIARIIIQNGPVNNWTIYRGHC